MKATRLAVRVTGVVAVSLLLSGAAPTDSIVSPSTVPVGGTVTLTVTNCGSTSGKTLFEISGSGRDRKTSSIAAVGGGSNAELRTAGFAPGAYTVTAVCGDGAPAGNATLTITPSGGDRADGRASGGAMTVAGGAVLLANALGGIVILARRRRHAIAAAKL